MDVDLAGLPASRADLRRLFTPADREVQAALSSQVRLPTIGESSWALLGSSLWFHPRFVEDFQLNPTNHDRRRSQGTVE